MPAVLLCFIWGIKLFSNTKRTVFLVVLVFLAGCSTLFTGKAQEVTFRSEPEGATVTVTGKILGRTPLTTMIPKNKNQVLTFELEGYKTFTTQLSTSLEGWFWGNIVIGGLFGSTTDSATGAMHHYTPDQYFITLVPEKATPLYISGGRVKIKELLVGFGNEIRFELSQGSGEYLQALISLIGQDDGDNEATIKVLRKLAEQNLDDLDFAGQIIDFYDITRTEHE